MPHSFWYADTGMPCQSEASAKTGPGLMQKIAENAKTVHNIDAIPPDLLAKLKKAIKK
jgi:predicted small metal-binding protein